MSGQWASYSQISAHRQCPQAWHYSYLRRLVKIDPDDIKVEMNFGSWWHMLMAADSLQRGRELGSLKWIPKELTCIDDGPTLPAEKATIRDVLSLAVQWWADQEQEVKDEWVNRLGENLPDRLAHLYQRWRRQWADERATERPLAVELGWRRALPEEIREPRLLTQESDKPAEQVEVDTMLVGYVDEVYFDSKRHMVAVRDHKTSKGLSTQTTADDMMDSQLQFYAWGASREVSSWGVGAILATAYDRVRTVKAKTPIVNQNGSLSKSITDFDVDTYLQWCESKPAYPGRLKDGSGAGVYTAEAAVIERLRTPAAQSIWFQRTLTPLSTNIVRAHLRAAVDSATEMQLTRARVAATGEAARNLTSGCRWCDMNLLCRAEMIGGPGGDYNLADFKLKVSS